jgi:uncharacterized protein YkwD
LFALFAASLLIGSLAADEIKKDKDEFKLTKEEQEVLDLTNQQRKNSGLAEMKANPKLFKAARDHSANMAARNTIAHSLDGQGPGERLAAAGYRSFGWAENVAMGQSTPGEVIQSWMNSSGHRANILSQHAEIGIGVSATAGGTRCWTMVFGNPSE